MDNRTPTDGKPFYCVKCKMGYGEYIACDLPDCELESEASAEMRQMMCEPSIGWENEIPDESYHDYEGGD